MNKILSVSLVFLGFLFLTCSGTENFNDIQKDRNKETIIFNNTGFDIDSGGLAIAYDNSQHFVPINKKIYFNTNRQVKNLGENVTSVRFLSLNDSLNNFDTSIVDFTNKYKEQISYKDYNLEVKLVKINRYLTAMFFSATVPPPKLKNIVIANNSKTPLDEKTIKILYKNSEFDTVGIIDSTTAETIDKKERIAQTIFFKDINGNYSSIKNGDTIHYKQNVYLIVTTIAVNNDIYMVSIRNTNQAENKRLRRFIIVNQTEQPFTINSLEYAVTPTNNQPVRYYPPVTEKGSCYIDIGIMESGEGAPIKTYSIGLANNSEFPFSITPIIEQYTSSTGGHIIGIEISNSKNCTQ